MLPFHIPFYLYTMAFRILIFLLISLFTCPSAQAQKIWKKLHFTHHGPFEMPTNSNDSGSYTPNGMGWIEMLYLDANNQLYAGSNTYGLYKRGEKGHWKQLLRIPLMSGVTDMLSDPNQPERLFVATANTSWDQDWGTGIWKSSNGGKRWEMTALNFSPAHKQALWQLEADPTNFNHQIALSDNRIYQTFDAWKTAAMVLEVKDESFRELLFKPHSSGTLYAAGKRLWLSTDGGSNWIDISRNLSRGKERSEFRRIALEVEAMEPEKLWAAYAIGSSVVLDVSYDGGGNFQERSVQRFVRRFDENHAEVEVAPDDSNRVYLGAVRLFRSDDGGRTFKQITTPQWRFKNFQHDDVRELLVIENGVVYNGNDGGVGRSRDYGKNWEDLSGKGLSVTQFYGIALNESATKVLGGCQDLGNMIYDRKSNRWSNVSELYGDGGDVICDEERWVVGQNGTLFESYDSGSSWHLIGGQHYIQRMWMPIAFDVRMNGTIYSFDTKPFRLQKGQKAKDIGGALPHTYFKIWAFAQSESNPNIAYLAYDEPSWDASSSGLKNKLFRCLNFTDSMPVWEDITSRLGILAWRGVSDLIIHPNDPKSIWISFKTIDQAEKEPQRVYVSKDGGDNWLNFSEGLPAIRTNTICFAGGDAELLFLGTDAGLYARRWYDPEWVYLGGRKRLPSVMVSDLEWDSNENLLWIGTYGNGLWSAAVNRRLLR